jgi:flagellar biosynthesis protein FlhB
VSESFQDRTEAATPRRREDARNKGEVPRSAEVTTAVLLLVAAAGVHLAGPVLAGRLASIYGTSTIAAAAPPAGVEAVVAFVRDIGTQGLLAMAPLLALLATAGLAIAAGQARGVLTTEPLMPKFERLSPGANLKKIFGIRSLAELAKSILKLLIIAGAMYFVLRRTWPEIMVLGQQAPVALVHVLAGSVVRLLATAGMAYLLIAGGDYAFQLWQHEKQLKMTKEEVKREHRESEGDPQVKGRMRSMARALLRRQMFTDVPTADVVVTNPTHIAVALRYDPSVSLAPIVLAMGQRKIAQRIKKLALESGVPVIENKPLARALLATGTVGEPIPAELYVAVAEVLAFVIRRRATGANRWAGSVAV